MLKWLHRIKKIFKLLDSIDEIKINEENILIKFNKNLLIGSEKHLVTFSKGNSISISNRLHLNPLYKKDIINLLELDGYDKKVDDLLLKGIIESNRKNLLKKIKNFKLIERNTNGDNLHCKERNNNREKIHK